MKIFDERLLYAVMLESSHWLSKPAEIYANLFLSRFISAPAKMARSYLWPHHHTPHTCFSLLKAAVTTSSLGVTRSVMACDNELSRAKSSSQSDTMAHGTLTHAYGDVICSGVTVKIRNLYVVHVAPNMEMESIWCYCLLCTPAKETRFSTASKWCSSLSYS